MNELVLADRATGPDISRADLTWRMTAMTRGPQHRGARRAAHGGSSKARGNGERHALRGTERSRNGRAQGAQPRLISSSGPKTALPACILPKVIIPTCSKVV